MNIRTKLIIGLTTLCGVFGGTAFLFYGQTNIFDDSVHDLSDFTQNHLRQNLDSLHLGAQLTSTLNQITNTLSTTNRGFDAENVVAQLVNETDEIGQVAIAFNDMVQRIQSSQKELQEQVLALELSEAELIEAKSNAEEANIAKSRFLANMSHELRTPLNGIIGFSEMMRDEARFRGDNALIPDLAKINAAGQHLLGLINDILDISKIESGRMGLYLETFNIKAMLRDRDKSTRWFRYTNNRTQKQPAKSCS